MIEEVKSRMKGCSVTFPKAAMLPLDLSTPGVTAALMEEPTLYALAAKLAKVEHWVFDRERPGHLTSHERERALIHAGNVLSTLTPMLTAAMEIIEMIVSLSSPRRFELLSYFDRSNPDLAGRLSEFAFAYRRQSVSCSQYVHWLEIVEKSQQIRRIFGEENAQRVCAVLKQHRDQRGSRK